MTVSVENIPIGRGIVSWKGVNDPDYRDLGNVPAFTLELKVETLEHESARSGIAVVDKQVVKKKSAVVKFTMEEWTPENLGLFLMGEVSSDTIDIFVTPQIQGSLKFEGTNSVGPKSSALLPNVVITPSAAISVIGDTWSKLDVSGDVLGDSTTGSFGSWTVAGSV